MAQQKPRKATRRPALKPVKTKKKASRGFFTSLYRKEPHLITGLLLVFILTLVFAAYRYYLYILK